MNIVDIEYSEEAKKNASEIIYSIIKIFSHYFNQDINCSLPNNEMFVNHLQLLSQRIVTHSIYDDSKDSPLYISLSKKYIKASNCVKLIDDFITMNYGCKLTTTENLYLLLHIQNMINSKSLVRK